MSNLALYNEKRNFSETTEPTGATNGKKNSFVVQWHDATRLHYDFRIEVGGVLKSWAVPKGPSLNVTDKRLAIMVEDHPLDYQFFEGTIPKGNYGAGLVRIWDSGKYEFQPENKETIDEAIQNGSIKFELKGKILKGGFALVKLKNTEKGNEWLLIKHKDEFATTEIFDPEKFFANKTINTKSKTSENKSRTPIIPKLTAIKPMLATAGTKVEDGEYIYEKKFDGYRCTALIQKGHVQLNSRNLIDFTSKYNSISDELKQVDITTVLDGELVYEENGIENFQSLADGDSPHIKYVIFDMLHLDGYDLYQYPLVERQDLLTKFFEKFSFKNIKISENYLEQEPILKISETEKWEGIIAKKKASLYYPSKRTDEWLKLKTHQSIDAVICGYTAPLGGRSYFGSLVLGLKDGNTWKYLGNCGTGFNEALLKKLYGLLKKDIIEKSPFSEKISYRTAITFVKPKIVCEVKYFEFTNDKKLRHPVFLRLRDDKTKEEANTTDEIVIPKNNIVTGTKKPKILNNKITSKAITTNLDKVYWPKENITKGNLIEYYHKMASYLLPYIKNRPLSLNRHPNGITKPSFFQKNMELDQLPKWVKTVPIHSDTRDNEINYLVCNDIDTLIYLANLGCIEINAWLSTTKNLENPDFVLIDLDPGEIDFKYVVDVALEVKALLNELKVECFCKTSGSSGLHIYIPAGAKYSFDITKQFAEWLAGSVHERLPKTTSVERAVKTRTKKIYIDFLQNRMAQTIAVPFSVRPKPGATVSFPLRWEQVNHQLKIKDYDIFNVPELVHEWENPWKKIFEKSSFINIEKVLNNNL